MRVDAFDFELPRELIAERPVRPRDAARLLEVSDRLVDRHVRDLPRLLRPGDALVLNDTRVIPARLAGRRGAARVEVTLHKRFDDASWDAFARPARKLRLGDHLAFADGFGAEVTAKGEEGEVSLRFNLSGERLRAALERYGLAPLPPYIPRKAGPDAEDREDYQTVFAAKEGAVAAPTAGLHFGQELFGALERRGVEPIFVTLHVGAATFLPVKVADTRDHKMRSEWGSISAAAARAINRVKARGGRLVAVGTTCLRLLESVAGAGGRVRPFEGEVDLFITPGYRFRVVDLLLTNFHLPRSTLFMLVSAFSGLERMKAAYAHAMEKGYRFYSYGDCTLLHRGDRA